MADQLISTAVHRELPGSYVRPEAQRPRLNEVVPDAQIPVVDLAGPDVFSRIGQACATYGFFQVVNHGVPQELMDAMLAVAYDFFRLPPEEKAKLYSDDPAKKMHLSTSFKVRKETVRNWRDYLRLHRHPLEQYVPDWPANPPCFSEIVGLYSRQVRELGVRLNSVMSESPGLYQGYTDKTFGEKEQQQHMTPELTYGLPAHKDPKSLTILLMDQQMAGLQVLNGGRWVTVNPRPNALVVNVGDQQLQVRQAGLSEPGSILTATCVRTDALSESSELVIDIGGDRLQAMVDAEAADPIAVGAKANPEETGSEHGRRGEGSLSAVLGIIAASSAVCGIAGGVINPALAFGFYLVLLGGLFSASASVTANRRHGIVVRP